MIDLLRVAGDLEHFLTKKGWPFAFLGGLAVNRWGRARTTNDADAALFTGFGDEEAYVDALLDEYEPRIGDAREFAMQNRVLLLKSHDHVGIDISLAAMPFEEQAIRRSSPFEFPEGVTLTTVSAEDLIILKAVAGRPQDWLDVEGILLRQADSLNMEKIRTELAALCELTENDACMNKLERLWQEIQSG